MVKRLPVLHWLLDNIPFARQNRRRQRKAMTLIELLVVISLIGILMSIAVPIYTNHLARARNTVAVGDIYEIGLQIMVYMTDRGELPQTLEEVGWGKRSDPWGNLYQYLRIEGAKGKGKMRKDRFMVPLNSDFDLYSMGKDGKSVPPLTAKDSRDDILRANNGGYIGLGSKF
ncbi:MAG: prepilin-type N-terminal cleavage/methylation domain-containing protein [Candidatus Aminicenantes bacterium]|nr:prepilin-type N-terminal cleavage/methylation domain-containing protein [Candidatus Aminicenantes bacterium]